MKPFLEREGKFNVLARLKDFHGFDLTALFDDSVRKFGDKPLLDFMGKRYRYRDVADLVDRAAKGFQRLGVRLRIFQIFFGQAAYAGRHRAGGNPRPGEGGPRRDARRPPRRRVIAQRGTLLICWGTEGKSAPRHAPASSRLSP